MKFQSTKIIELGSCAFRQWRANHSHCQFIHGYRLIAKFWFTCNELDDKNWVVDFGGLKELKNILEKQFDHTFCVSADDPLISYFKTLHDLGAVDLRIMDNGVGIERTAEWCFDKADKHIREITNNRCSVEKVEVWEHDKNSALYIAERKRCCNDKQQTSTNTTHTAVAAPAPEIQEAIVSSGGLIDNTPLKNNPKAASVGNKVTSGFGNLFGGTSWGK